MTRKDELKEEAIMRLEMAIAAISQDWPETARQHIVVAEKLRHEWDAILVKDTE